MSFLTASQAIHVNGKVAASELELSLSKIVASPYQIRVHAAASVEGLAKTLKSHGLMQSGLVGLLSRKENVPVPPGLTLRSEKAKKPKPK